MSEENEVLETEVVDPAPKEEGIEATYRRIGEAVIDQQFKNRILALGRSNIKSLISMLL